MTRTHEVQMLWAMFVGAVVGIAGVVHVNAGLSSPTMDRLPLVSKLVWDSAPSEAVEVVNREVAAYRLH